MKKPKIYNEYKRWCLGEDVNGFDDTPIEDIKRCSEYDEYLKSNKGKVININNYD